MTVDTNTGAEQQFFSSASRRQNISVTVAILSPGWGIDEEGNYWVRTLDGKWHVYTSTDVPANIRRGFEQLLS